MLRAIVDCSPVAIYVVDAAGIVSMWNPAAERLFGWSAGEAIGQRLPFVEESMQAEFDRLRRQLMEGHAFHDLETTRRRRDGSPIEVGISAVPLRDSRGVITSALGMSVDVTDRVRTHERLRHEAFHDSLTGLLSRAGLLERMAALMGLPGKGPLVLLLVGLDGTRRVDESLGLAVGDELRRTAGSRLADAGLVGVEALVRWDRPGRGRVGPADFVPLAEETGLIASIGEWVLSEACAQAVRWRRRWPDRQPLRVSVNLSVRQIEQPDLLAKVSAILESAGADPSELVLEITESVMARDVPRALDTVQGLAGLGVGLAIDDFGTGYSSLSYLKRLPAQVLKVDRAFIQGIARDGPDASIVAAVVDMAHALGLTVVAEGIETAAQATTLVRLGCELGQGYHFARPTTAEMIDRLLLAGTVAPQPADRAAS